MPSIRHLDTIIEADQCSCLQLMSSARPLEIAASVKIGLCVRILAHWVRFWALISNGRGFCSCIFSFISRSNFLPALKIYFSSREFARVRTSHVFCILFHPGLVVMDLRCKTQDRAEEAEGARGTHRLFFAFIGRSKHAHKCKDMQQSPETADLNMHEEHGHASLVPEPKQLSLAQTQHQGLK